MKWFKYQIPESSIVKFNRLILGLILVIGIFSQRIEFLHLYLVINVFTLFTTIRYSPTTGLFNIISHFFNKAICSISKDYERSYFMNRESEWFELLFRILASFIAISLYETYPLATWLIAVFMGVFMMISTFFGFCLASLWYIGLKSLEKPTHHQWKAKEEEHQYANHIGTNEHCILARNGFKPYARCDYCALSAQHCAGIQFNGFVSAIVSLVVLFMFLEDLFWINTNIIAIIILLFWLAHKVTINTDKLASADFKNRELNDKLKYYNHTLEAEVLRRTEELEKLVKLDSITGLFNRYEFEQRLTSVMSSARNDFAQHVMCYIDLDQFKIVNDKCGHIAGDELLRQVALILKRSSKESDVVARLGGDEFGIIYLDTTMDDAVAQAQKLLNTIGEYRFNYQGNIFSIGASIGMVAVVKECCTLNNLLAQADAACYAAKDGGRNRIHIAHAKDKTVQERRNQMQWIGRLEEAVSKNAFVLYIQSIVPVDNPSMRQHYEVLVRLPEANGTDILPMAFIPAAERYGFMSRLDRWVIENTFKAYSRLLDEQRREIYFSINISGSSLSDEGTVQFIRGLFGLYSVPYRAITFEITETEAVGSMTNALMFINEFRALGCKFALDDFGCGLSSFSYLQNMPIDYLKIDGSFVHDIHQNPINRSMVDAINQIGHVMGIKTICEYVETKEVLTILNELNVDYAQGHYIDKPFALENLFRRDE